MADQAQGANQEKPRSTEMGIVISDKRDKTITVEVRRLLKHAKYGKYLYKSTKLHAHDEKDEARTGDRVLLEATRPVSKQKRWRLLKILEKAPELDIAPEKSETKPS
ncbi:MAG: 30S ribosomal protein S17 [Planctomycetota bacterium]|nr:30S ribosomal protein S17 [Planctomycetota bacterium]